MRIVRKILFSLYPTPSTHTIKRNNNMVEYKIDFFQESEAEKESKFLIKIIENMHPLTLQKLVWVRQIA